jgi:hypothetical protein
MPEVDAYDMERRSGVREGGMFLCIMELVTESVDAAEEAGTRLRSSSGVRSVVRSALELVRIKRGDDGRVGSWLRRRHEYEYSARCVWVVVSERGLSDVAHGLQSLGTQGPRILVG